MLNRTREAFADVVRETPGIAIAAFGLGMSVTARMVRLQVSAQTFPSVATMALNGIILSVCLLALALAYRLWPGFRLSKHPVVALATAVASSAALVSISLLPADAGLPAAVASETVPLVCSDVVLLIWAETLRSYGPRRSAVVFALAGAVASLTTLCLGTVKSEFELGVVAMLPILAVGGLFLFFSSSSTTPRAAVSPRSATRLRGLLSFPWICSPPFLPAFSSCAFALPMQRWDGRGHRRPPASHRSSPARRACSPAEPPPWPSGLRSRAWPRVPHTPSWSPSRFWVRFLCLARESPASSWLLFPSSTSFKSHSFSRLFRCRRSWAEKTAAPLPFSRALWEQPVPPD